ncbi:MAG: Uma2 family endonuclease, partial [Moorea sp. SIO3B2]|nr:Uma2 family endonuclease [Moorena sp. SIO3B2]
NGEPFASYLEISEQRDMAQQQAELERLAKEQERQRAEQAEQALELERTRMKALLEQLKAKGINPDDFNL